MKYFNRILLILLVLPFGILFTLSISCLYIIDIFSTLYYFIVKGKADITTEFAEKFIGWVVVTKWNLWKKLRSKDLL